MGATDFVNPKELQGQSIVEKLVEMTDGGLDYTLCVHRKLTGIAHRHQVKTDTCDAS